MFNYKLTKNFTLSEFFITHQGLLYECELIACMCVVLRNIILHENDSKVPLNSVASNLKKLALFLQEFRDSFNIPIKINSGYRSEALNEKVGGVSSSLHRFGKAVDISFSGLETYSKPIKFPCGSFHTSAKVIAMVDFLKNAKNSGRLTELIIHDTYIHIAL